MKNYLAEHESASKISAAEAHIGFLIGGNWFLTDYVKGEHKDADGIHEYKGVDLCAEPGEYTYDLAAEPSVFAGGDLAQNIKDVFKNVGKRLTFGGEAPKDQRVYYFNAKELIGNKCGTPAHVPFRVVDNNIGLDADIPIRCFGEYSCRVTRFCSIRMSAAMWNRHTSVWRLTGN